MTRSMPVRTRPDAATLVARAQRIRWHIVNTVAASGAGHIGGPLSATDLLVALYFSELNIDPDRPDDPGRDRFILSKGHSAIGLYATLAVRGYFPEDELATFDQGDSRLQGHPDMLLTPGVDSSSGSLGQGLSVGAGMAMAAKKLGHGFHTWVMVGDGELEEGMIWETVILAPRYGLDNLTMIIDLNGLQQYGWPATDADRFDRSEPMGHVRLESVLTGFGWRALTVDGHDFDQIFGAFDDVAADRGRSGRPTAIIARTVKGRGVSFTEGRYVWHNGIATTAELRAARRDLGQEVPR